MPDPFPKVVVEPLILAADITVQVQRAYLKQYLLRLADSGDLDELVVARDVADMFQKTDRQRRDFIAGEIEQCIRDEVGDPADLANDPAAMREIADLLDSYALPRDLLEREMPAMVVADGRPFEGKFTGFDVDRDRPEQVYQVIEGPAGRVGVVLGVSDMRDMPDSLAIGDRLVIQPAAWKRMVEQGRLAVLSRAGAAERRQGLAASVEAEARTRGAADQAVSIEKVLDLIDDCPGLTMEQDRWLSQQVRALSASHSSAGEQQQRSVAKETRKGMAQRG